MRGYDGKLELVGWSDNSRYLASSAGNEVVLWDFSGKGPEGTRPIVLNGHTERVDSFAWQPGGEHLVSAGRDWRLTLWRPGQGQTTHRRADARFGDQRGALVARRQTPGRGREERPRHRVRPGGAMTVELARPDARRAQGSAAALRSARQQALRAVAEEAASRSLVAQGAARWPRVSRRHSSARRRRQLQRIGAPARLSQRRLRRRVLHREPERAEAALPPHRQTRRRARAAGSRRAWCRTPPACWHRRSTCS